MSSFLAYAVYRERIQNEESSMILYFNRTVNLKNGTYQRILS